nr:hypothetical protein [Tanacetum cinerariifolium]
MVLTNTSERVKAKIKIDKNDIKEPVPGHLSIQHPYVQPTPFLRRLKGQKGNLYKIHEAFCMIGILKMIDKEKTQVDNSCNIMVKDVERLRQMLTPTIHTLPNLKTVVQPYMPLSPFRNKANVTREEELDNDIPLHDGMMQFMTPQTAHNTPPDDVAPATSLILDKNLNEFEEEFFDDTRVAEKADSNPVNDVKELIDIINTDDFETFVQKLLLHQVNAFGNSRRLWKTYLIDMRRPPCIITFDIVHLKWGMFMLYAIGVS